MTYAEEVAAGKDRTGCEKNEVPLRMLGQGERFDFVGHKDKRHRGTVLRHGPGTSAVVMDGFETEKTVQYMDGREKKVTRIGGISLWSDTTPVVRLKETRDISRWLEVGGSILDVNPNEEEEETAMALATASLVPGAKDKPGGKPKIKVVKAAKTKTPKQLNPCKCGCGEMVTGRFRMGHDSTYYSRLRQVVAGKLKFSELSETMRKEAKNAAGCAAILKASNH